jgi:hypothetical protein
MVSLELIVQGTLVLALLGLGSVFAFRVATTIAFQRRYAEALSSTAAYGLVFAGPGP